MNWIKEKSLHEFDDNDLTSLPFFVRVASLVTLLIEMNTLHKNYYVHGDIKPGNLIFDPANHTLKLIDFGTSHKAESLKRYGFSEGFLELNKNCVNNFCDDMYALGMTLKFIFPELDSINNFLDDEALSTNNKLLIKAIDHFKKFLLISPEKRCTSEEALTFCQEISRAYEHQELNEACLETFEKQILDNPNLPFESIIRGRFA